MRPPNQALQRTRLGAAPLSFSLGSLAYANRLSCHCGNADHMGTLETFLITPAAAAVSGLAWLAYRHPRGYQRIARALAQAAIFILVVVTVWNLLEVYMATSVLQYMVDKLLATELRSVADHITKLTLAIRRQIWAVGLVATLLGYLYFLYKLQKILGVESGAAQQVAPGHHEQPS